MSLFMPILAVVLSQMPIEQTIELSRKHRHACVTIGKLGGHVYHEKVDNQYVVKVTFAFGQKKVPDAAMRVLPDLLNLDTLDLGYSQLKDSQLKYLNGLRTLRHLALVGTNITDAGLRQVKSLPSLEELNIQTVPVGDAGLAFLGNSPQLRILKVSSAKVTDKTLELLRNSKSLEKLDFSGCTQITDKGLAHLRNSKSLRWLSFARASVSDKGLAHLSSAVDLQYLDLVDTNVSGAAFASFRAAKHLKELYLDNAAVNRQGLSHIVNVFPNLERLGISDNHLQDQDIESLARLKSITCFYGSGNPLTDRSLKLFSNWRDLHELFLCETKIAGEGFGHLANCTYLSSLIIGQSPICDKGLDELAKAKLEWLRSLRLYDTNITDRGLKSIANIRRLRIISLENTHITGEGLEYLKGHKELRYVYIGGKKVRLEHMKHFALLPELQGVIIRNTTFTKRDVEKILPNILVDEFKD